MFIYFLRSKNPNTTTANVLGTGFAYLDYGAPSPLITVHYSHQGTVYGLALVPQSTLLQVFKA